MLHLSLQNQLNIASKHCRIQIYKRLSIMCSFWKIFSTPSISIWIIKTRALTVKWWERLRFIQVCGHSAMVLHSDCCVKNVASYLCVVQAKTFYKWFVMLTWQGNTLNNLALLCFLNSRHSLTIVQHLVCPTIIWFTMRMWGPP